MITNILPDYQKKVRIKLNSNKTKCGYDIIQDIIVLNLKKLHNQNDNFKKDLEKWLNIKMTFKQFIVFCLLHELGHRYRELTHRFNIGIYNIECRNINENLGTYDFRVKYWNITEEKFAMDYAKRYFKKYLRQEKRRIK